MAESLNRSELESLLTALNPARKPSPEPQPEAGAPVVAPISGSQQVRKVVKFFEGIRRQSIVIAEQCVSNAVRLKRYMPDRVSFSELRERLEPQSIILLVETEQSGGDLLFLLDRETVFEFVAEMLGQSAEETSPRNELSPLELRILTRWLRESLIGLLPPSQWKVVAIDLVESSQELKHYADQSPWWCERWELILPGKRGSILVSGQWEFLTSLSSPQSAEIVSSETSVTDSESENSPSDEDDVSAVWSENVMRQDAERPIEVGDVLQSEGSSLSESHEIVLQSGGREVARGRVGESQGHKAVEITEIQGNSGEDSPPNS